MCLNVHICECVRVHARACVCAHFIALSKIHRLLARFCYSGLPAVLGQGGTCSRNRSVDLGDCPSCCAYQLCWQFDGNFNLALFPCWCLCYIEDNIWWKQSFFESLPSSPRILLLDNIPLLSFSKCFIFLLWDASVGCWLPMMVRQLLGGSSVVAILPEATCFPKNGLNGRVDWQRKVIDSFYHYFLVFFPTPLVSESSALSVL